jgi:hypothetical protein
MDDPCRNCRALHFRSERREGDRNLPDGEATYAMCCKHGQIRHAPISHPFPEEIKLILKRLNPSASPIHPPTPMLPGERTELNTHIRHANGRHAFASMNTTKTIEM